MSTTATNAAPGDSAPPPGEEARRRGPLGAISERLRSGELGAWPVIIGLIAIWVVFASLSPDFLTAQNLSNLSIQIAAVGAISVGVVLVLLLGEIDLSVGSVAGLGAAALAWLSVKHNVAEVPSLILVLILGVLIGVFQGWVRAGLGVPSFVVTLAGNLGWLGLQLYLLYPEGTINIPDNGFISDLTHTYLTDAVGWSIGVVAVGLYALAAIVGAARRARSGLPSLGLTSAIVRVVGLGIIVFVTIYVLNAFRGVPLAFVIFVGLVVIMDLILRRTRYGRGIFAVGGNVEAARRAGINISFVRITVFALCSMFAAFGGVLLASRTFSASQSTGTADTLLVAIAAAVIGGVSLFGGRGSTYGALLGSLVLGSITSGMLLLQLQSSVRFMITAAVLLAAVILDSLSRRGRVSHGRE